jgi:hypothetical protein
VKQKRKKKVKLGALAYGYVPMGNSRGYAEKKVKRRKK